MATTVSQSLAEQQGKGAVEALMWQKVATACKKAGLPLDDGAPDFVVGLMTVPTMGVFRIAHDAEEKQEIAEQNKVFPDVEEEK